MLFCGLFELKNPLENLLDRAIFQENVEAQPDEDDRDNPFLMLFYRFRYLGQTCDRLADLYEDNDSQRKDDEHQEDLRPVQGGEVGDIDGQIIATGRNRQESDRPKEAAGPAVFYFFYDGILIGLFLAGKDIMNPHVERNQAQETDHPVLRNEADDESRQETESQENPHAGIHPRIDMGFVGRLFQLGKDDQQDDEIIDTGRDENTEGCQDGLEHRESSFRTN